MNNREKINARLVASFFTIGAMFADSAGAEFNREVVKSGPHHSPEVKHNRKRNKMAKKSRRRNRA